MKIAFVIFSLGAGGAERVAATLANAWAKAAREVLVITLDDAASDFFPLDGAVTRTALGMAAHSNTAWHAIANNLRRIVALRAELRRARPDLVISFMDRTNVLSVASTRGLGIPVIACERTNPGLANLGALWSRLRAAAYRSADALVVQTEGCKRWMLENVRNPRVFVVPNPVAEGHQSGFTTPDQGAALPARANVVGLGRLAPVKGFDLLIQAFARVKEAIPGLSLCIVGAGAERDTLLGIAAALDLGSSVFLPGRMRHPWAYLRSADLFVLPSRYEGFPNALCEAMSCGLPVVAVDCEYGPAEIVRHNVDGVLVPRADSGALSTAILQLLLDAGRRASLALRAPEIKERLSVKKVLGMWDGVLSAVRPGIPGGRSAHS